MSTTEEFPEVHLAYGKYVESFSANPTNPTQLINFCKKNEIQGVTWSKCSKYFKLINGQSTIKRTAHKKTTSGPILKSPKSKDPSPSSSTSSSSASITSQNNGNIANHSSPKIKPKPMSSSKPMSSPKLSSSNHRRAQSAIDAKTHKQNVAKSDNVKMPFQTVMLNDLFTDLKEDPVIHTNQDNTNQDNKNDDNDDDDSKSQTNGDAKSPTLLSPKGGKTRISITPPPPTSFKSIFIEQTLKPLSSTTESAPAATIQKTVKKEVKKHPLLEKPWNKHKSSIWPKNRYLLTYIYNIYI